MTPTPTHPENPEDRLQNPVSGTNSGLIVPGNRENLENADCSSAYEPPYPPIPADPATVQPSTNESAPSVRNGFFSSTSKTWKAFTIGALILFLLIPVWMIRDVIHERRQIQQEAIEEVSDKWSTAQTVTGPYLVIRAAIPAIKNGQIEGYADKYIVLLPDELSVDGQVYTETRRRGIYQINVYTSELTLSGTFSSRELKKYASVSQYLDFQQAACYLGVTDLRGISEQIGFRWNDTAYVFEPGIENGGLDNTGVCATLDIGAVKTDTVPFEIKLRLKGSQSLFFTPVGKTTKITLQADWNTPSFAGGYLPEAHQVNENGFTARWQILHLNRNYPQAFSQDESPFDVRKSAFGVNLRMPVETYQQAMRTAKYAVLIIALAFIVIFFVEIRNKKPLHVFQYFLVGMALCIFYTLLLALSEQVGFNEAYLIASALTVALVVFYLSGVLKRKQPALVIGGLLTMLYVYIYILIQLETLALLAGSLGLFIVLALVMYFSRKIDWVTE